MKEKIDQLATKQNILLGGVMLLGPVVQIILYYLGKK